jgi:glycosyltransferase involved in cell wall biosynthesis
MIRVAWVRGKYLNPFEGQNYVFTDPDIRLTGISSLRPIDGGLPFPVIRFPSLPDIDRPIFADLFIKYLTNRLIGDRQILFGLEKIRNDYDIFHTADPHYYYSYQLALLRQKKLINKLLVTSWETIPFNNEGTLRKSSNKKFVLKNSDAFLCYSLRAKESLILEGVGQDKISLIRAGVDLKNFFPKFHKKPFKTLLFVGRLVEEKGVIDLYQAYRGAGLKDWCLKIIGNGGLKKDLLTRIKKDGLKNKVSIADVGYRNIPDIYRHADILIIPSKTTRTWEEQYGMVMVEGLASGLPLIAYDSGSLPELMDGKGLLVKEGDTDSLARAILRLAKDDHLRAKLGKMGRERAEAEFDCRQQARKLADLYRQLI